MLIYFLDPFGVAVFAASGVLAGIANKFDLLGILVLASITAIGDSFPAVFGIRLMAIWYDLSLSVFLLSQ